MAAFGAAVFGISYCGPTKFKDEAQKVWDISFIKICFSSRKSLKISAELFQSIVQKTTQYPLFRIEDAGQYKKVEERNTILAPEAAVKTMKLFAQIFHSSSDGSVSSEDKLIDSDPLPSIEEGKCYWIQIMNKENSLRGTVVEVAQEELTRSIRLARLYPNSMIYSPLGEMALTCDQEAIYSDFEVVVYVVSGWINQFANKAGLPPPLNGSFYESVAKTELRRQIARMPSESIEHLLQLKKEGDACLDEARLSDLINNYQKAQIAAIGSEGYAAVMRKVLEAFAGDSASEHREKIEEVSAKFSRNFSRQLTSFP